MKTCTKCGEEKPLDSFHRKSSAKDGRDSACKRCVLAQQAAYRAGTRDAKRERDRRYAARRGPRSEYQAAYYAANRDRIRARHAVYYSSWAAANKDLVRENSRRRRARLRAAAIEDFTFDDLLSAWDERGLSGCAYCPDGEFEHVDHVVPLARGGAHAIENLVPACGRCNQSKGAKLLEEWLPGHQASLAASV